MALRIIRLGIRVPTKVAAYRDESGRSDGRRVTFEVLALLSYYASGQGLLGLLLVHGFPRTIA